MADAYLLSPVRHTSRRQVSNLLRPLLGALENVSHGSQDND